MQNPADPQCLWIEFLQVAVQNILYHRKVYPKKIFTLKKKYNTPIQVITHDGLNQYITNVMNAANFLSRRDHLEQVHLQISDEQDKLIENYVFNVINFDNDALSIQISDDPFLLRMENHMRACLVKLSVVSSEMATLPENAQFELLLKLKNCHFVANIEDDQEFQKYQWTGQDKKAADKNSRIIPLECIETKFIEIELYIEDSRHEIR